MKSTAKRTYHMQARAESARNTEKRILEATEKLWLQKNIGDITLEEVAEAAEVTVRTVIRKYTNKEGLIGAALKAHAKEKLLIRDKQPHADWKAAVRALLQEYEANGDAVIRTLAVESEFAAAAKIVAHGRRQHLQWCTEVFSAHLPAKQTKNYKHQLLAVRTVTDIYIWKLLRRDLNNSLPTTTTIMTTLITGILKK